MKSDPADEYICRQAIERHARAAGFEEERVLFYIALWEDERDCCEDVEAANRVLDRIKQDSFQRDMNEHTEACNRADGFTLQQVGILAVLLLGLGMLILHFVK